MNYTQNYHLPQWVETDRILMDDFNDAYSAIDAALDGLREDVDANESAIAANDAAHASFGNCKFYTGSYVGAGQSLPTSHTFPAKPMVVAVSNNGYGFWAIRDVAQAHITDGNSFYITMTWEGNTVTWQYNNDAGYGVNWPGTTYHILALLQTDA